MAKIALSALYAGGLFVGVWISLRLGWRLGRRRFAALGEAGQAGLGAVEGAVFGLMGLLIAFTFTGAASRFSGRSDLIIQQANAIGTAWMRLDLLPEPARSEIRDLFRHYLDAQLAVGRDPANTQAVNEARAQMATRQAQIWEKAIGAVRVENSTPLTQSVLPPINEMFDLGEARWLATRQHPPFAVFLLLGIMVLVSALMAGFGMGKSERQSRLHLWGFASIMALAVYLILDLEYPRLGLVRIDSFDQALFELRAGMK